jgi:hypothetical protein
MKTTFTDFTHHLLAALSCSFLITISVVKAQEPFQIVWGMNGTLSGAATSTNFLPTDASLTGAHQHSLPAVLFYALGGGDFAFGTTYWQAATGVEKFLAFSFSVSTFEYDITSVSFRVRRSGEGPQNVSLRSSLDGFTSDLSVTNLTSDGTFFNVTVPIALSNLKDGLGFRLLPYNAGSYQGVLYFDQIVINGTLTSKILPVQLTYLKAKLIEKSVFLSWETATELNSQEFVIERSQDLVRFLPIGIVAASGESAASVQYSFHDMSPLSGVNYYRLRMIDQDRKYTLSNTVDAIIRPEKPAFSVSPNPANANLIRIKTDLAEPSEFILTNVVGQNIPIFYTNMDGNYINLFPNHTLSSGIYVLSLKLDGIWEQQKVWVP